MNPNLVASRTDHQSNYKTLDLTCVQDKRLSLKSKGLFFYIMSRPDDWNLNKTDLMNQFSDGSESIQTGMKELLTYNYLFRTIKRNSSKQIEVWGYYATEIPKTIEEASKALLGTGWEIYHKNHSRENLPSRFSHSINNKDFSNKDFSGSKEPEDRLEEQPVPQSNPPGIKILRGEVLKQKKEVRHLTILTEEEFVQLKGNSLKAKEIFLYWNNLGGFIQRHRLDPESKTVVYGLNRIDHILNKGIKPEEIRKAMSDYKHLIEWEHFGVSLKVQGVITSIREFFDPADHSLAKLNQAKVIIESWFDECSKGWGYLESKYSKEIPDKYPEITKELKNEWRGETKRFTPREENILRKTAERAYTYFINLKDFDKDLTYNNQYPASCMKLIWRCLAERSNFDFGIVPYWIQGELFFERELTQFLKEIGYIIPGLSDRQASYEYDKMIYKQNMESKHQKEEEEGRSSLSAADFI